MTNSKQSTVEKVQRDYSWVFWNVALLCLCGASVGYLFYDAHLTRQELYSLKTELMTRQTTETSSQSAVCPINSIL